MEQLRASRSIKQELVPPYSQNPFSLTLFFMNRLMQH